MLSFKWIFSYALLGIFIFSPPAFSQRLSAPDKGANLQQSKEKRDTRAEGKITRSTEFVKEITGDVLVTEKNRYRLKGVNVVDRGQSRGEAPVNVAKRKRVAEMLFVNGGLKEVVLH